MNIHLLNQSIWSLMQGVVDVLTQIYCFIYCNISSRSEVTAVGRVKLQVLWLSLEHYTTLQYNWCLIIKQCLVPCTSIHHHHVPCLDSTTMAILSLDTIKLKSQGFPNSIYGYAVKTCLIHIGVCHRSKLCRIVCGVPLFIPCSRH